MVDKIDLLKYVSKRVKSQRADKEFSLENNSDEKDIMLSYCVPVWNSKDNGKKEYALTIPRFINKNKETFEVIGLLQAEMGKTGNGMINFCNCEHKIINKVIKWFDKELEFSPENWKWYIKLNLKEPKDENVKKPLEERLISYWLDKTKIDLKNKYPKAVIYVKETNNKDLKRGNYGTLTIERKKNLFSQIIKNFVKQITNNMPFFEEGMVRAYLSGIIAGEGCVENAKKIKSYRVHISSTNKKERDIYQKCLEKLGIVSRQYKDSDSIIISKRKNNVLLLKQKLMCLSPAKYNKFLEMMRLYPNISNETGYFKNK